MIVNLPPLLRFEILRVNQLMKDVKWYMFGSFLKAPDQANDIDILVVYRSDNTADIVRRELREVATRLPIHLLFLSESEEAELQFVDSQRCVPILR